MTWEIQDIDTLETYPIAYRRTGHFIERSSQRNLSENMIQTVIDHGMAYFKQGLIFYVLGDKNVPKEIPVQDRKRYRNIVAVISSNDATIITAYRSKNPFKHIKKKSNKLYKAAT